MKNYFENLAYYMCDMKNNNYYTSSIRKQGIFITKYFTK
ncbi:hypothetical protein TPE_1375 [Treponema pedis str. T A4]|uniref:Uncharacterized protein n=1 Tax=Treponema pedis str. T A4 TaxID=1291379 RepID=S5ZUK7_9SPIR|nr:hypothetical protein TPE_1375 [Treponema pedis str. T A4]